MRNNFRTVLTTTAVLAALAGGSILYAYADSPSSRSSGGMMQGGQGGMMQGGQGGMMQGGQGGMMQGGQSGMMNMMGQMNQRQMNQMMDTGNNMMKGMAQDHGPETPEKKSPENKD